MKLQAHLKQGGPRGRPSSTAEQGSPDSFEDLAEQLAGGERGTAATEEDAHTGQERVATPARSPVVRRSVQDYLDSGGQGTFDYRSKRTMSLEERFPSWFRFKAWLTSRMFDDKPIIMMLRLKSRFR